MLSGTDASVSSISFSFLNSCLLGIEIKSLVGHKSKLKDVPKLTSMIQSHLKQVFVQNLIYPNTQQIQFLK